MTSRATLGSAPSDLFREEMETFREQLPALRGQWPGWYAVVKGNAVVATCEDQDDALKCGYILFGEAPFMVELITEYPTVWSRG